MPLRRRFGFILSFAFALVVTTSVAGCEGDAGNEGKPSPAASPITSTATAAPLGGGEFIVFERLVPGKEERKLYTIGPHGGKPQLLRSPGEYPHWSPDGSKLTFNACLNPPGCTTGVALIERSTGEVHGFTMPDPDLFTACAIWAPSGRALACEGDSEKNPKRNGVYTVRVSDGNGLTRITRNPGGIDFPLTYSPDGRRLLFVREPPSGDESERAVFVTPAGGGKLHRITPSGYSDDYASWSPDGRTIVFGTGGDLYRVSPDGTGLAKIAVQRPDGSPATHAFDVSFSPDGRRIVFSLGGAEPGIYQAKPDGSDVKRLTTSPTEDHHANWGAPSGS
jgi:Tol biopolymer transport system component